jgi:transcriptional regulator with XRE-family HTH domain
MDKKAAAKLLFMDGWEQKDIAELLKVSENTLSKWVRHNNWGDVRTAAMLFETTSAEAVRELIGYQLEALRRKKNELVATGEFKLLDRGDIDALQKLFTTIKRGELKWDDHVRTMRRFMEYLQERDPELAKRLISHADVYLNDIRQTFA